MSAEGADCLLEHCTGAFDHEVDLLRGGDERRRELEDGCPARIGSCEHAVLLQRRLHDVVDHREPFFLLELDAGICVTSQGTILVTTFTSLAYEPILQRGIAKPGSAWPQARLDRWKAAHQALSKEGRDKQLGTWVIRSKDGGATWLGIQRCPVNSPHGPIQLTNGRILYAGKTLWKDKPVIGVCTSDDDGATWSDVIAIPTRPGDEPDKYHELHAVDNGKGTIIAHIRNHNS